MSKLRFDGVISFKLYLKALERKRTVSFTCIKDKVAVTKSDITEMDNTSDESNAVDTIIHRKKKTVLISNQEIIMMLRAYNEHPCSWIKIIASIKENMHALPEEAQNLYKISTLKQLKNRLSGKLSKLLNMKGNDISNVEIRSELNNIKELEKKLIAEKQRNPVLPVRNSDRDKVMLNMSSEEEGPSTSAVTKQKPNKRKVEIDSSDNEDMASEKKPLKKKKKKSVMDLVRENQLEYSKFIMKKMPKLMKALGVSSSSDSD